MPEHVYSDIPGIKVHSQQAKKSMLKNFI